MNSIESASQVPHRRTRRAGRVALRQNTSARTMELRKEDVLRMLTHLRSLFRLNKLDVCPYSDEAIAAAVLQVCPIVTYSWPSDAQLRAVFQCLKRASPRARR